MKSIQLGVSPIHTSCLAYGCWRIAESGDDDADFKTARAAIHAAIEAGFILFDLADIYCRGRSETMFGRVMAASPDLRQGLIVATKCGIRFVGDPDPRATYRYDFSADHILRSCEESLRRLQVETIDLYQLHRPDWLMNPDEVAAAFDKLFEEGKVRTFGVSNFRPSQVELLQQACGQALVANQIEASLLQLRVFEDGTLDQCLANQITPMAWSPLAGGMLGEGATKVLPSQSVYSPEKALAEIDQVSLERGATRMATALAWLMRHPAGIVPIVGSTQPERIRAAAEAANLELTREEWYRLLSAARSEPLP